jgi:predicted enzyme related to lactoylglutathione lyase
MQLNGMTLITSDVPALAEFYAKILGKTAEGDHNHADFKLDGAGLAIFTRTGMEMMAPGSMQGAGNGCVTLNFEVANVDSEYARIQALGVTILKPIATHPWGARAFWFRDLDGNVIDFYSRVQPQP